MSALASKHFESIRLCVGLYAMKIVYKIYELYRLSLKCESQVFYFHIYHYRYTYRNTTEYVLQSGYGSV